jgi:hypothetical protein
VKTYGWAFAKQGSDAATIKLTTTEGHTPMTCCPSRQPAQICASWLSAQRRFKPFDETEARSSSGELQFGQFPLAVQVSALPEDTDPRLRGAPVSASKIFIDPLETKTGFANSFGATSEVASGRPQGPD